jgi:cytidylate kinase
MSIITLSRRPFSRGSDVAERVAQELGYACVAREVLFDAAGQYGIHTADLVRAVHDAPSFSDHFHYGRERYVSYFQAALLQILQQDNVVYHGLAGHFFVQGVAHALKVRVITSLEERVKVLTEREHINRKSAARMIRKEDRDRRKWSRHLYGMDTWDPAHYDIVLNIQNTPVDVATAVICHAACLPHFQRTPQSQRTLDDLALAARVKAAVVQTIPRVQVTADGGRVTVRLVTTESQEAALLQQITDIAGGLPGVEHLEIDAQPQVHHDD